VPPSFASEDETDSNSGATTAGIVMAAGGGAFALVGLVALLSADTKAIRPDESKSHGTASMSRTLVPTANFDTRGSGSIGLAGTLCVPMSSDAPAARG
jgi:hypothetical protein